MNIQVWQEASGPYHYQIYKPGVKGARKTPTVCGLPVETLEPRAWFAIGDRRGRVHYARACDECSAVLTV